MPNNNQQSTTPAAEPTTSVMILQDTDVTITGVYVNSSVGASQESYCKMQYRVQSSVTEERVLRHNSQSEPPKCYTPLSALSSMRPPVQAQGQGQEQQQLMPQEPTVVHPPEMTAEPPNMTEYHRDPGLVGLTEYHHPEYSPYGPHPSMYHHNLGPHPPPPQHMMGPGPSNTSAFQPAGPPMQGQHELGGKCKTVLELRRRWFWWSFGSKVFRWEKKECWWWRGEYSIATNGKNHDREFSFVSGELICCKWIVDKLQKGVGEWSRNVTVIVSWQLWKKLIEVKGFFERALLGIWVLAWKSLDSNSILMQ